MDHFALLLFYSTSRRLDKTRNERSRGASTSSAPRTSSSSLRPSSPKSSSSSRNREDKKKKKEDEKPKTGDEELSGVVEVEDGVELGEMEQATSGNAEGEEPQSVEESEEVQQEEVRKLQQHKIDDIPFKS